MTDTKQRILDTAECLFAENGFAATSLRAIIAKAGVNLAAIHYHFHSKEALLEAVILRRAAPANQERMKLLDRCEQDAGNQPPSIEKVIEAFVAPAFRQARDPALGGPVFRHLTGRLYAEGDMMPRIIATHFRPVLERFATAIRRALPEMPPEELMWRVHFATGVVAQALRGTRAMEMFGVLHEASNSELVLDRLVTFLSAGFRAPVMKKVAQRG